MGIVMTWIGHFAITIVAVAFMMLALGLPLLWLGRLPPATCGALNADGCPCSPDARSTCVHAGKRRSR